MRIGVHAHLETTDTLLPQILETIPADVDIHVTSVVNDMPVLQRAHVDWLQDKDVDDVAALFLYMRPYVMGYDLFCHVHDRIFVHSFGRGWRDYLLAGLLGDVADIVSLFEEYPSLGCLFPPIYPELKVFMEDAGIDPMPEIEAAEKFLARMGLNGKISRSEIFYSPGHMFWFRPKALRQMFSTPMKSEDLDSASCLHAIVAVRNGYEAKSYLPDKAKYVKWYMHQIVKPDTELLQ